MPARLRGSGEWEALKFEANGETLGSLRDLWFELPTWTARYLVVRPAADDAKGTVISTAAVREPAQDGQSFHVEAGGERGDLREPQSAPRSNLHRARMLLGCQVQAIDGAFGRVTDFLVEEPAWVIRCLVVAPQGWASASHVALATAWVAAVDWPAARLSLEVDRKTARASPAIEPRRPIGAAYASRLRLHYRKPVAGTSTLPTTIL